MFMFFAQAPTATPEPGTFVIWSLLAVALAVFGWWRTKRRS
jgi:MYXO-CTERM domain-containing protein